MGKLTGKVAVVTGASKGIGAAIAEDLAREGASVVVNYASSGAQADAVVAKIKSAGGAAKAVRADISKVSAAPACITTPLCPSRRKPAPIGCARVVTHWLSKRASLSKCASAAIFSPVAMAASSSAAGA